MTIPLVRSSDHLKHARSRGSFNRLLFESQPSMGSDLHKRPPTFVFMQLIVILIRMITPLSYFYLLFLCIDVGSVRKLFPNEFFFYLFSVWMSVEIVFFPYYYHLFNCLNSSKSPLRHYASTRETRMTLIANCFGAMKQAKPAGVESHTYLRKV